MRERLENLPVRKAADKDKKGKSLDQSADGGAVLDNVSSTGDVGQANSPEQGRMVNAKEMKREQIRISIDRYLEMIINSSEFINAGNNGMIFKITPELLGDFKKEYDDHPEELVDLQPFFAQSDEPKAVKILKVYHPGKGEAEFKNLEKAYNLVNGAIEKGETDLALVPTPVLFRTLKNLDQSTIAKLNKNGARLLSDQIEILIMEYLPGKDLATIFYQWVIEHHPQGRQTVEGLDFNTLHRLVENLMEYKRPGGKHVNQQDQDFERQLIEKENAQRLFNYLRQTGFVLDLVILEKIKKTLKIFHENGFFHNDAHPRNFIVNGLDKLGSVKSGSDREASPEVYIVDFGSAGGRNSDRSIDEAILGLEPLTLSLKDEERKKQQEFVREITDHLELLVTNEKWLGKYNEFLKLFARGPERALENLFVDTWSSDFQLKNFIVTLKKLITDGLYSTEAAKSFLTTKIQQLDQQLVKKRGVKPKPPVWLSNQLKKYTELF